MKILHKKDALHAYKPEGLTVDYYLRKEYELHNDVQDPHTTQVWHHHDHIHETLFITEGELLLQWKENGILYSETMKTGNLIETENTPHTCINQTDSFVRFIVIKQVLSGTDKRQLLKTDKVLDHK